MSTPTPHEEQGRPQDMPQGAPALGAAATAEDYETASSWAETATFEAGAFIPAEQDPDFGRALIRSARAGRPALDPTAPGEESRARPVRLDKTLDQELQQFLSAEERAGRSATASSVMRAALRDYLAAHRAS